MLFNEAVPMQSDTARCGTHPLRTFPAVTLCGPVTGIESLPSLQPGPYGLSGAN